MKPTKTTPNVPIETSTTTAPTSPVVTPVASASATSAPAATSQPVVVPAPPPLVLPSIPAGWMAVDSEDYRGFHARAAQVAALPNALTEVSTSPSYGATFGPVAPSSTQFVLTLQVAEEWSNQRIQLESFLTYVKSEEMVAWKAGLTVLEQLNAVYKLAVGQNAEVAVQFPALTRLFAVRVTSAKKAAATSKRNRASKAAKVAAESVATAPTAASSATNPGTTTPAGTANGGAAH